MKTVESILLAVSFCCTACASSNLPPVKVAQQFSTETLQRGYRFDALDSTGNSDKLYVILVFSGGGTRAASLSYGVLKELNETWIEIDGQPRRLIDEVDVISSVSGGSFAAAYLAAFGRDKFINDFEKEVLLQDIQGKLTNSILSPIRLIRYLSSRYNVIDYAAEIYNRILEGKTFGDLRARPYVIINATDMSRGSQFSFTQEQFDIMCNDLASYPIARAVAASSAFPVLLAPVTVENNAGRCRYQKPPWVKRGLEDCSSGWLQRRRSDSCFISRTLASYENASTRRFIHLLDGGIADNIGLRPILRGFVEQDSDWNLTRTLGRHNGSPPIERGAVALIVVNAKTSGSTNIEQAARAPGWRASLAAATGQPMANFTDETFRRLIDLMGLEKDDEALICVDKFLRKNLILPSLVQAVGAPEDGKESPLFVEAAEEENLCRFPLFPIEVSFASIEDPSEREFFLNLPTSLKLEPKTVQLIYDAGGKLLREDPMFQSFLREITHVEKNDD